MVPLLVLPQDLVEEVQQIILQENHQTSTSDNSGSYAQKISDVPNNHSSHSSAGVSGKSNISAKLQHIASETSSATKRSNSESEDH